MPDSLPHDALEPLKILEEYLDTADRYQMNQLAPKWYT